MKLSVIKLDGKASGDVELSDAVFGITDIRGDLLARYVNWQLAKRRAGTHKVQTRNENSRTGKKMYKQKGTGGARHGSRRAPQFVGGSRAFGPVVREHGFSLPSTLAASSPGAPAAPVSPGAAVQILNGGAGSAAASAPGPAVAPPTAAVPEAAGGPSAADRAQPERKKRGFWGKVFGLGR